MGVALVDIGDLEECPSDTLPGFPERLRAPHWRGYNAAMQAGRTEHAGKPTLTKALHASGESIYVQMSFAVVVAPDGAMQGSVAIARSAPAPTPATPR